MIKSQNLVQHHQGVSGAVSIIKPYVTTIIN